MPQLYDAVISAITLTGSAQQLYTPSNGEDPNLRFVSWASVEAKDTNTHRVFVGNSSVTSSLYSTSLAGGDPAYLGGPEFSGLGVVSPGIVDLSKFYIIGTAGEKVMVTIFIPSVG